MKGEGGDRHAQARIRTKRGTRDEEDGGCVSGPGCTNTGYSQELTVNAGEIYYLLVDGYLTAVDPNYTINFGGTASTVCPVPMTFDKVKWIEIVEEDMPEPLKILQYHKINGKKLTKDEAENARNTIIVVMYEDGTRGKLQIKIE